MRHLRPDALLSALVAHARCDPRVRDDVTLCLGEIVEGPPGPALWHLVRNRLIRPLVGS